MSDTAPREDGANYTDDLTHTGDEMNQVGDTVNGPGGPRGLLRLCASYDLCLAQIVTALSVFSGLTAFWSLSVLHGTICPPICNGRGQEK